MDTGGGVGHVCFLRGVEEDQAFLDQAALSLGVRKPAPLLVNAHQMLRRPTNRTVKKKDHAQPQTRPYYGSMMTITSHLITCVSVYVFILAKSNYKYYHS